MPFLKITIHKVHRKLRVKKIKKYFDNFSRTILWLKIQITTILNVASAFSIFTAKLSWGEAVITSALRLTTSMSYRCEPPDVTFANDRTISGTWQSQRDFQFSKRLAQRDNQSSIAQVSRHHNCPPQEVVMIHCVVLHTHFFPLLRIERFC